MKKNVIITENQLRLITEALGVPDSILEAAEVVYDLVAKDLKSITTKDEKYSFSNDVDIELGGKKKIKIRDFELVVNIEEYQSQIKGKPIIISMGMSQSFTFDRGVMMKKIVKSETAEMEITYGVGENWEPSDLYDAYVEDRSEHLGSIAHELKHKYDKQSKEFDLIGRDAEYRSTQSYGSFGIPIIDGTFMRYLYYTTIAENLVRATEVASQLKTNNITKSQFKDFISKNRVYKELVEIKNFTFKKFIQGLRNDMDGIDRVLNHINEDPSELTEGQKINRILELVYINLVNTKMSVFMGMTGSAGDNIRSLLRGLTGSSIGDAEEGMKMEKMISKFSNHISKYRGNTLQFFKDEIENFNYIATKMLKKIGKLYDMAKDDETVSESIINWDLHQQSMVKKYGKRKIETDYKFKR
jgi:hypothetical protein